jgi:hypothetical protein
VDLQSTSDSFQLNFAMDSKGGGTTIVRMDVGPTDFPQILQSMTAADRQAAMTAMSAELARQVDAQPAHDAKTRTDAREAVRRLAQEKYAAAPSGNDETERFIFQSVKKLLAEIEQGEALDE